VITGSLSRR